MKIGLKPISNNVYPKAGFLIQKKHVVDWAIELHNMQLNLAQVDCYALPGQTANCIWGCLVIPHELNEFIDIGKNTWVRKAYDYFLVPDFCQLTPALTLTETQSLLKSKSTFVHPTIGFFELEAPIVWSNFLLAHEKTTHATAPAATIEPANKVSSFILKAKNPEDAINDMVDNDFPKREKIDDKPLTFFEKSKLLLYKALFAKSANTDNGSNTQPKNNEAKPSKMREWLSGLMPNFVNKAIDRMQSDMDNLEERNKKEVEKLMDMIKKDPSNALKYAIPLDEAGVTRGQKDANEGLLKLGQLFGSFSLFNNKNNTGYGGGSINIGDHYYKLKDQYEQTARTLIKNGDYKKAAFVYLKLLQNANQAAETLKKGKLYNDAAAIYIKYLKNNIKAAECYTEGRMYNEAIEIYKKANLHEKAGDLYMKTGNKKAAAIQYEKELNKKLEKQEYYNAGHFAQNKMDLINKAQEIYLKGWHQNFHSKNCLSAYFNNINNEDELTPTVKKISSKLESSNKKYDFVEVLTQQIKKHNNNEELKDIAFEIAATEINNNHRMLDQLHQIAPDNTELRKDTSRFKLRNKFNGKKA